MYFRVMVKGWDGEARMEAEDFGNALSNLCNLEFAELELRSASRQWGHVEWRRIGVNTANIVGVIDPSWDYLPTSIG